MALQESELSIEQGMFCSLTQTSLSSGESFDKQYSLLSQIYTPRYIHKKLPVFSSYSPVHQTYFGGIIRRSIFELYWWGNNLASLTWNMAVRQMWSESTEGQLKTEIRHYAMKKLELNERPKLPKNRYLTKMKHEADKLEADKWRRTHGDWIVS